MIDYYVDSISGLDTNDGLSKDTAFQTLQALLNGIATTFTEDTNIYLMSGLYTCDDTIVTKIPANITLNVIGLGMDTTLKPDTHWGTVSAPGAIGVSNAVLNFNKLIFNMSNMLSVGNPNNVYCVLAYNNVVFISDVQPNTTVFNLRNTGFNGNYYFKNCLSLFKLALNNNSSDIALRNIYVENCYGYFTDFDTNKRTKYTNSYLTDTPTIDNQYRITDATIPITVGVYSGIYSWSQPILLKMNNQYYSIKEEFYDTNTQSYLPLPAMDYDKSFLLQSMFVDTTINGETFKPINKFNNFQIVNKEMNTIFNARVLKTDKQLIVGKDDINTSLALNIDYFKLQSTILGNGIVKLALSIDSGKTWKTWNTATSAFEDLNCAIPKEDYKTMTDVEKIQWNDAMEEILTNGITPDMFNGLDFNLLDSEFIRFAYVLNRNTYLEKAETSQLDWKFDARGSLRLMKPNEFDVDVYTKQIRVTSLIDNPIVKVNVMV